MNKLIILSTQRSGSTMVCDDIAGTEVLGKPSEYFIKVIDKIILHNEEEIGKAISEAVEKGKSGNGFTSIKIMSNQIIPIGLALQKAKICTDENKEKCFYNFLKDYTFIRIIREDKVAQAVSRVIAYQSDVYHSADSLVGLEGMLGKVSKKRDETLLKYNSEEIKDQVNKIKAEEIFLNKFIENNNLDCRTIIYEDVINDRNYINELALKFGISNIKLVDRRLKKISSSISSDWIKQYNDIK